jgi:type VI secretion system protein ImpA
MNRIDIEALRSPIRDDSPCGDDYSFSAEFDEIKRAREEDDPHLSQGEWARALKVANWPAVVEQSVNVLQNKSKDIRAASWLAEGLAHAQGYQGLADGCVLLRKLCDDYWPSLYPLAENGDQELRIGAFAHFVTTTVQLVRSIPVTQGNGASYSCADYDNALHFENLASKNPELRDSIPDHKVTLDKFGASQQKTPRSFYEALQTDFSQAQDAWKQLAATIDTHLGVEGPSFTVVFDAFAQAERVVQRLLKEAGVLLEAGNATVTDAPTEPPPVAAAAFGGPIANRAQALQQLQMVADFFRRTEPHSPVAYLASRAVQWGNMPLHEWLRAVIKDGGTLSQVEELLGLGVSMKNEEPS